jgi:hypothetical protein
MIIFVHHVHYIIETIFYDFNNHDFLGLQIFQTHSIFIELLIQRQNISFISMGEHNIKNLIIDIVQHKEKDIQ